MEPPSPPRTRSPDDANRRSGVRALLLVCLVAIAIATNYTNHGPLLGLIGTEFGLTGAEAGAVATAFFVGTFITVLFGGLFADRFGPRPVVAIGFGLVAVSNLASGLLAPSFPALLAWRVIGGLGAGSAFAAGASYTRGAFPSGGAHLAQGLYGASFLIGSGATLLFIPAFVGEAGDWRRAFAISGLGVLACWVAWVALAPPGPARQTGEGVGLSHALRTRNTWLLAMCHMCGFGLAIVVSTWATGFLVHRYDLPLAQAGALGSALLATGIAARSAGGAVLERGVPPVRLIQVALAIAALGLFGLGLADGPLPAAMAGLVLTGLGAGLPYAAVFNGVAASVPRSPASAQAVVGWGATGFTMVGPTLVGGLLDLTGSFSAGFLVLAAFTLAVLAATTRLQPFQFGPTLTRQGGSERS